MASLKILLPAFILVCLAQIYVPASMILQREAILDSGKEFKFKTAPVDPNDPFRGKYILLRYEDNSFDVENVDEWKRGETIYVLLGTDSGGFVKITSVSMEKPDDNKDYLKTEVEYAFQGKVHFDLPFNRYYMEESKAFEAELTYNRSARDTTVETYALVNIKDGEAVLKDVMIGGRSIREIVKERLSTNHN